MAMVSKVIFHTFRSFLVILGPFWPFFAIFGHFGSREKLPQNSHVTTQKWQHLLILLQPQRVTLPFQRKFCYPPTPGSHQICLSLWYTFWKKGCWELVRSLRLKQFLYTTGGLLVITYLLAWVHSKWKIGSFFLQPPLNPISPRGGGARGTEMAKSFQEKWLLLKPSPLKFCPSRGRFEWSHD